jgi:hypothetical protein
VSKKPNIFDFFRASALLAKPEVGFFLEISVSLSLKSEKMLMWRII